jgi:tripartite-type tricarboxylate transporter receptor subunit TctC
MREPDVQKRIADLGYLPIGGSPSDYAENIKSEIAKWAPVIKAANIKAE